MQKANVFYKTEWALLQLKSEVAVDQRSDVFGSEHDAQFPNHGDGEEMFLTEEAEKAAAIKSELYYRARLRLQQCCDRIRANLTSITTCYLSAREMVRLLDTNELMLKHWKQQSPQLLY